MATPIYEMTFSISANEGRWRVVSAKFHRRDTGFRGELDHWHPSANLEVLVLVLRLLFDRAHKDGPGAALVGQPLEPSEADFAKAVCQLMRDAGAPKGQGGYIRKLFGGEQDKCPTGLHRLLQPSNASVRFVAGLDAASIRLTIDVDGEGITPVQLEQFSNDLRTQRSVSKRKKRYSQPTSRSDVQARSVTAAPSKAPVSGDNRHVRIAFDEWLRQNIHLLPKQDRDLEQKRDADILVGNALVVNAAPVDGYEDIKIAPTSFPKERFDEVILPFRAKWAKALAASRGFRGTKAAPVRFTVPVSDDASLYIEVAKLRYGLIHGFHQAVRDESIWQAFSKEALACRRAEGLALPGTLTADVAVIMGGGKGDGSEAAQLLLAHRAPRRGGYYGELWSASFEEQFNIMPGRWGNRPRPAHRNLYETVEHGLREEFLGDDFEGRMLTKFYAVTMDLLLFNLEVLAVTVLPDTCFDDVHRLWSSGRAVDSVEHDAMAALPLEPENLKKALLSDAPGLLPKEYRTVAGEQVKGHGWHPRSASRVACCLWLVEQGLLPSSKSNQHSVTHEIFDAPSASPSAVNRGYSSIAERLAAKGAGAKPPLTDALLKLTPGRLAIGTTTLHCDILGYQGVKPEKLIVDLMPEVQPPAPVQRARAAHPLRPQDQNLPKVCLVSWQGSVLDQDCIARMTMARTDFHTVVSYHRAARELHQLLIGGEISLEALPLPIGLCAIVVTEDNQLLLRRRGKQVYSNTGRWEISASEWTDPDKDCSHPGTIDIGSNVHRALTEPDELNLKRPYPAEPSVRLFGMSIDWELMAMTMYALVQLHGITSKAASDRYPVGGEADRSTTCLLSSANAYG